MFAGAKSVYFYKCSRWFFFGFSRVAGCGRGVSARAYAFSVRHPF